MLLCPPSRLARRRRSGASLRILVGAVALWLAWGAASASWAQGGAVTFSVIGDIPYSATDADRLRGFVADHNAMSPAGFFVHVGDIKAQTSSCPEPPYVLAFDILSELAVPTFVLPGDNEWNDCADPDAAWILWQKYFSDFEQRYCGTPPVEAQAERSENFAFVHERVLFLGLNLVGGTLHDADEWNLRMQQNAAWVEQQLAEKGRQVRAAVVLGHAQRGGARNLFFDRFDAAALAFGRPILFVHGDGHSWAYDSAWGVANLWRIQIEQHAPPLEVTVTLDPQAPFVFERDPWPPGTPVLNQAPCVDAGPDQLVPLGQDARLDALVSDDGDPAAGGVGIAWSQRSGPGQTQSVVADPGSAATTASFPEAGSYVLRLRADDGALAASDDIEIYVDSGEPSLWIRDAAVVEGDAGATAALFRVDLLSATGAPVRVDYRTADVTAAAGPDYQATSGSVVFSGATTSQSLSVPVLADTQLEEFETFRVLLENPSAAVIADGAATGLIRDDDAPRPPVVTSFAPASGPRGSLVSVTGDFGSVVAVSVAGVPAEFSAASSSELELVVPATARSGPIAVTTAGGTAESVDAFVVELRLSVDVLGAGSVSLVPPREFYLDGESVTLTPLPASGWEFLLWSGDLGGMAIPAVIQMTGDASVTASFVEAGSVALVPRSTSLTSGSGDAEEDLAAGGVSLTSSDLELAVDVGGPQAVGLHFAGVAIPQGAQILSASVQFTVDEVSAGTTALSIRGEAADDAAPFRSASGDVSDRPPTSASVAWSPPEWRAVGEAGAAQRTPDLSALVQEIVDRPGWAPGNALALVVTGPGTRTAESYDGSPGAAARLEIVELVDLAPPETPANLHSPDRSETSIELAWDPAYDNLGVTGYRLYRPEGPLDVAGTSYTANGLAPDTEYAFRLTALDAAGHESPPSPVLRVRTVAPDREPPTTPQNLRSPARTETSIELAWNPAQDNLGVTGYRLYRPEGPLDVAGTSYTANGLAPDTEYAFQLAAFDAAGNESRPSPLLRARTAAPDRLPPTTPQDLRSPAQTETSIALVWNAATDDVGVTSYRVYRPGGPVDVPGTAHTETGLAPARAYAFQVAALDAAGKESAPSRVLVVRTRAADRGPPTAPQHLRSPAQTETSIDLAWDASSDDTGVTGYRLYLPSGPRDVPGTTYSLTGLAPDTAYAFQVSALDAAGHESRPSAILGARTRPRDRLPPTTPQDLSSPAQTETSIALVWSAATDDVGVTSYRVYRPGGPVDVPGTTHTETGLAPARAYAFQVAALDAAGKESAPSLLLVARTRALDRGPPTAPQNLRSPAQTETSIDLAWDASSDDTGVTGYRLYLPTGPRDVPGTTYSLTGLAPDTAYAFQVAALDAAGHESRPSAVLGARTRPRDRVSPITPQNLSSPAQTETSIALVWSAATGDAGDTLYRLYLPSGPRDVQGTTYSLTGLAPDTVYAFQVAALDAAGEESAPSLRLVARTRAADHGPPTTPQNLRSPAQTETSIDLAWDASSDDTGVTGYRLYLPSGPRDVPGTTYSLTDLAPDTTYAFQVAALDAAGKESAPSLLLVVRTLAPDREAPTTPQSLRSPAQTDTSIELAWDAATDGVGVVAYRLYRHAGPVDVAETHYTETGLTPRRTYGFQVSALDAAGNESAPSSVLAVRAVAPDVEPPTTPQSLRSPTQTETSIALAWDASSDDEQVVGYRVYGPSGPVEVSGTTYTATGLALDTEYAFRVSALDAAGNESAPSPPLAVSTLGQVPIALALRVASGDDDAEEDLATRIVSRTSSDLELAVDVGGPQAVGLRFAGVAIPQGAQILSASVQFSADELGAGPIALTLRGEASDDAAPFAVAAGDVSGRPVTSASAAWSPPDWTTLGAAGAAQRTPDLSALVQEIVDRAGWSPGHALVLVVTGTGKRTAESYNGLPAAAARLDLVYRGAPDRTAPSTPGNLRSPLQTANRIDLAWDASSDDVGVTGYRVYGPSGAVDVTGTNHAETGLARATPYDFRVSALDAAGNESAPSPLLRVSTTDTQEVVAVLTGGDDDVEEDLATGSVNRTSSDLELAVDVGRPQAVGLRFAGLGIPQGASIVSASVQWRVDEVSTGLATLTIHAEAADDAAPFALTLGDVSARPATSATVPWSPPAWTAIGDAGAAQRTPDLAALLQEVVDRPGWLPGHSLVLVVTGTGTRTAESHNGLPAAPPLLRVEYRVD